MLVFATPLVRQIDVITRDKMAFQQQPLQPKTGSFLLPTIVFGEEDADQMILQEELKGDTRLIFH
jgi:hypothetical protein